MRIRFGFGWRRDDSATESFLASNKHPLFDLCSSSLESHQTEDVLLYENLLEFNQNFVPFFQKDKGICVGCAAAHVISTTQATELVVDDSEAWNGMASVESLYGLSRVEARGYKRNNGGDGSNGSMVCRGALKFGVVTQQDYSKETGVRSHDLRKFSISKTVDWGKYGSGGRYDRGKLDRVSKRFPLKTASLVTSFDGCAKGIENGYCTIVCSNVGYEDVRDKDGFCKRSGEWNHAMAIVGVRWDRPGLLVVNSWSNYIKDTNMYPNDIPAGLLRSSFWISPDDANLMLKQNDSYILSPFEHGFEPRSVNNLLRNRLLRRGDKNLRHRLLRR